MHGEQNGLVAAFPCARRTGPPETSQQAQNWLRGLEHRLDSGSCVLEPVLRKERVSPEP